MKNRLLFALVFACTTLLVSAPLAYSATVLEVYPTGVYPADAQNVQAALNTVESPGTVILRSVDTSGNPLAFNFGPTSPGAVIELLRPDITLTGDGWDEALNEPKTKIIGGGKKYIAAPTLILGSLVFAVNAPGVTIRELKLTSSYAGTGVLISSVGLQPSGHPVVVERNHISVRVYGASAISSAALPVKITHNVFRGCSVSGQWLGFTLRLIDSFPFDEPVPPMEASGNVVRFPVEITNNRIENYIWVFGWGNAYSSSPDEGCRKVASKTETVYQCGLPGDNGPVLISGNDINIPGTDGIEIGGLNAAMGGGGINHVVVQNNTMSGSGIGSVSVFSYAHDVLILNNDFSQMQAFVHIKVASPDTTVSGNILGSLTEFSGFSGAVGLFLSSEQLQPFPFTPKPHPVENCVIMKNDYRLVESGTIPIRSPILIASGIDMNNPMFLSGGEVKNNLIFETGRFPADTGGARNNIDILTGSINPDTGLPYVHNNRIVGEPAVGIQHPGIGWMVPYMTPFGIQDEDAEF